MTKQEILNMFSDINYAYNDSSKYETLSGMIDEVLKEMDEYKENVLRAIRDYEKQFDHVDQYEIANTMNAWSNNE